MSLSIEAPPILPDVRTPRRRAVRPSARPAAERVKSTICLPLETSRRLTIFAAMTGCDRSEVVAGLIEEHLRRFVVQDRGRGEAGV
jgi:hypothetical protein